MEGEANAISNSSGAPTADDSGGEQGERGGLPLFFTPEGTTTALVVVIAPRGGGKTTLMSVLARELGPDDRLRLISPVPSLGRRMGLHSERRFGRDDTNEEYFSRFLEHDQHTVLVIDEFDEYCPSGVQGKFGGYCCDALYRIVNYGRNPPPCLGMLVSFRGGSDVTTNLLRAANVLFVGRTQEPNALDYFSRYFGREYSLALHNLPDYVFVVWAEGRLYGYVKVVNGSIEWIDPPSGWPVPNDNAFSAGPSSVPTDTAETPIESDEKEMTSATSASVLKS